VQYAWHTWGELTIVKCTAPTTHFGTTFATVNLVLFALNTICF
jgi:hypothetical protein